jgi:hypothetical protein
MSAFMRAVIAFPNNGPGGYQRVRVWLLVPSLDLPWPTQVEVTNAVLSFTLEPGGAFEAELIEKPVHFDGVWLGPGRDTRRVAKYTVRGSYEVARR